MDNTHAIKSPTAHGINENTKEMLLKQDTFKAIQEDNIVNPQDRYLTKFKENNARLNFSNVWNGSVTSLMSCENLTDNLVAETMKELESALSESNNLLSERDREITKLRKVIEDSKTCVQVVGKQEQLLQELESSQKRIIDLESELGELKRANQNKASKEQSENLKMKLGNDLSDTSECTCYCGSVCNALREINAVKQKLEQTEHKYATIKRKIREKRKADAEAANHKHSQKVLVAERSPGCVLQ